MPIYQGDICRTILPGFSSGEIRGTIPVQIAAGNTDLVNFRRFPRHNFFVLTVVSLAFF